jgi:4-hydroxybenzoate polyprenyltransferase
LPFAVLGAFLAAPFGMMPGGGADAHGSVPVESVWRPFLQKLALIVLCMVSARTWAMVVNRLADRGIDSRNARTRGRAFASGTVRSGFGIGVLIACAAVFVATTSLFWFLFRNPWPLALSLPVLAWIAFYSFTKRFTVLCHFVLGSSLAFSPIAAALAVDPSTLATTPALWCIAAFVLLWVAGFDVLYAIQDEAFDRAASLHSIPAKIGTRGAVRLTRVMHALCAAALVAAWKFDNRFGWLFACAVVAATLLLLVEHTAVARHHTGSQGVVRVGDGTRESSTEGPDGVALHPSWFTLNGLLGVVLGLFGVLDVVNASP